MVITTITFDKFKANGVISGTMTDFFDVAVENAKSKGDEEEITFSADCKLGNFTISNVGVRLD